MKSENYVTREEGNSITPNVLIEKTSEPTVVTLSSILRFALFFTLCLAVGTLLVGWYLGYFERIVTR